MNTKTIAAVIGLNVIALLFAYSIWAEWGPYAWAIEITDDDHGRRFSALLAFIMFAPFGFMLLKLIGESQSSRTLLAASLALPILGIALHFSATAYFLLAGDAPAEGSSLVTALESATFLPRAVRVDEGQLALTNFDQASVATSSRQRDGAYYILFVRAYWPDSETPVFLKTDQPPLGYRVDEQDMEGTVRYGPLPYFVRRDWGVGSSDFGIIVAGRESIRDYWRFPGIVYAVSLALGAWFMLRDKRAGIRE